MYDGIYDVYSCDCRCDDGGGDEYSCMAVDVTYTRVIVDVTMVEVTNTRV